MIHTIRFRLTVLYSGLLFLLAALVLGGIYYAVSRTTEQRSYATEIAKTYRDGEYVGKQEVVFIEEVENAINVGTLATLRDYSLYTLGGLFAASLGIGWLLSGRVLRPVRSITRTTEEIQATDLSRRITLRGPSDELKDLADTIDTMLDRLEEAFRAQRQLIDDASHELRSPLTIIRANVDAVLLSPETSEEERGRAVAVVDRATTRMTRLVEDLLASARRQGTAFADTDLDLSRVAVEACEEYAALATARGLTITRRLVPGLETTGDQDALRRAVANLLSNAVRLSPPGGRVRVAAGRWGATDMISGGASRLRPLHRAAGWAAARSGHQKAGHREAAVDEAGGWLWVAVRDDGPGLAAEDQARVFDRFWRGEASRRDRHTGLGLAIVRQIVESHGGRVAVHSRIGEGATFVLWLPARGGAPGPAPDHNPFP
ncbi:sensor histidine kinase [Nonomuraea ferruginea]|uniref:histidine kinase n=1 Tax=Nonomuraea ferruginea TaxID=46174 RepID=A0ABT4SPH6_9ACTN|nr:HAMP domain-containing sensor histidine kinase [Nonomuraea ferruginea]MDA0639147.1 HAMP domain-containing sensor histidine kinase [Nonomuraea ferruginea]